jgi:hypothetical protein
MIAKLFDAVFGCWHSRYSFPMTARRGSSRSQAATRTGTYVVCLDCGKELPYDWKQMKIVDASANLRRPAPALATKEAA